MNVETCDVKMVSPPDSGWLSRKNVVRPGGCSSYETSECHDVDVSRSSRSKLYVVFASR